LQQWIEFNVKKAVVKILQGSVVTQTTLGGLATYSRVANFLQCTRAKKYDNWLAEDKVIPKIIRLTFLAHPVYLPVARLYMYLGSAVNSKLFL